jgi:hypothetical protein
MLVTTKIDTTGLSAALALAQDYTKRTPALAVNTAMLFVARGVAQKMRKVSTAAINTELAVHVIPGITLTPGGKLSKAKKNMLAASGVGGASRTDGVPLGVLIVMASMKADSKYNRTTGWRYARLSRFTGGPGVFVRKMKDAINRMIKARRSSTAFIASSVIPIIRAFEAVVEPKYRRGAPPLDAVAKHAYSKSRTDKGEGTTATEGITAMATALFNIGGKGMNQDSHNEAMHRIMGPIVQQEVKTEGERQLKYVAEKRLEEMHAKGKSMGVFA